MISIKKIVGLISSIYFLSVGLPAILAIERSISITQIDKGYNHLVLETKNYKEFQSDKTYVILVKEKSEEGLEIYTVLYWIGRRASEVLVENAAEYAIELHFKHASKADLTREVEGRETSTFRELFEKSVDNFNNSATTGQGNSIINEEKTRMILIQDPPYGDFSLKEIEFSPENINRQDICFVAFNLKTIFLYCGEYIAVKNVEIVDQAVYLTKIISTKMGSHAKIIKNVGVQSDTEFLAEFRSVSDAVEKWKASSDYKGNEIVNPAYEFYIKFRMVKIDYYVGAKFGGESVYPISSSLFPFQSKNCYIFDACLEDVGMLVWIGTESDLNIQRKCASNAELHYKRKECSDERPIIFIKEENIHLPKGKEGIFKVDVKSFINIMLQLHLSWIDVLENKNAASREMFS